MGTGFEPIENLSQNLLPPRPKQKPHETTIHGETLTDAYYWLREKSNPEVLEHLAVENAYADQMLAPPKNLQEEIAQEIISRTVEDDTTVPAKKGSYWYFTQVKAGFQYPLYLRSKKSSGEGTEVLLDLNELVKGHAYIDVKSFTVSDDGTRAFYLVDTVGYREYQLVVIDLETKGEIGQRIDHVTSAVWCSDNASIYYVTEDAAKRPATLYRYRVGDIPERASIFEEKDALYGLSINRSRDGSVLFLSSTSSTTKEIRWLRADAPMSTWQVILPREEGHEYHVSHRDGMWWIRTNRGAKDFRLVTVPMSDPRLEKATEIIPAREAIRLENVAVFRDMVVAEEKERGLQRFRVISLGPDGDEHRIDFPESVYALFDEPNHEYGTSVFRFRFESPITPPTVYEYDMATYRLNSLKQSVIPHLDPSRYCAERIWAPANDGTRIPITLLYRKGTPRDGSQKLHLYGYGAYGISLPGDFDVARFSYVDRGVSYAIAHVRGGGELGELWREGGKMLHKKNSFSDFIAAAEHLIAEGWTSKGLISAEGASAGGLLMGAVVNARPDLWKSVLLGVPFLDVINTMSDPTLPLTIGEYLEWGNPNDPDVYRYIKSYCPYTNVRTQDYPPMLVTTSLHDSQVGYWEPTKWVAKVRDMKTDANPVILHCNMNAGHGGDSGRYDAIKETARDCAFGIMDLTHPRSS